MALPILIDKCITAYGEMDIAIIVMALYADSLPTGKDLYIKLHNEIPKYFLERATYWTEQANKKNQDLVLSNARALQEISLKFKETKFKKAIMEEIDYLRN